MYVNKILYKSGTSSKERFLALKSLETRSVRFVLFISLLILILLYRLGTCLNNSECPEIKKNILRSHSLGLGKAGEALD